MQFTELGESRESGFFLWFDLLSLQQFMAQSNYNKYLKLYCEMYHTFLKDHIKHCFIKIIKVCNSLFKE